jgi:hypothetical protein
MKKIFTTKISLQSSNPTFSYPIIRLPRDLKELAGRVANIYQAEIDGVQGFFIALQLDKLDNLDIFVESHGPVNSQSKCDLIYKSTPESNGLGRIRTGDLRRVKTEVSEMFTAFPSGAITTRKASAPS